MMNIQNNKIIKKIIFNGSYYLLLVCFMHNYASFAAVKDKTLEQKWDDANMKLAQAPINDTAVYLTEIDQWSTKLDELLEKSKIECDAKTTASEQSSCRELVEAQYKKTLKAYFKSRSQFYEKIQQNFTTEMKRQEEAMLDSHDLLTSPKKK